MSATTLRLPNDPNSRAAQKWKRRNNLRSNNHNNKRSKSNPKRNHRKPRKKNKNQLPVTREEAEAPKSFIIIRGRVTKFCKFLRDDLRLIFSPYTAAKLREKQSNSLKDFQTSAIEFGVTHLLTLSQSDIAGTMLRMIRLPRGPTFWFKIKQYSLIQDIVKMQSKYKNVNNKKWNTMKHNKTSSFLPHHIQFALRFAPLVILNGFGANKHENNHNHIEHSANHNEHGEDINNGKRKINRAQQYHKQLMSVMFKHMFSPMNVINMKLSNCKRVVFFNYDSVNDCIEIRHYKIQLATDLKGVSKGIKKILKSKKDKKGNDLDGDKYPDLSGYKDVTDYVEQNKDDYLSESEVEDDENTKVVFEKMKDKLKNVGENTSFVRLKEIGPRITMELIKIEELVNDGKVLYHRYIEKTEKEKDELQKRKDEERKLKEERRVKQELNVKRKEELKKEKANKRLETRKQREVEKLLKSFEIDENDDDEDQDQDKKQKRNKKRIRGRMDNKNNQKPNKKRKFNQKQK